MAINTYLSIITLNVNGLNAPIKRHRIAEWIGKQELYVYMMSTTDTIQSGRHTQTERKGMEKDISCKWKSKKNWGSNTYIWLNRLEN